MSLMSKRRTGPEDREIGRDLARKRRELKLTQADVADRLQVSAQQYGKYERGENRLSVARHKAAMDMFQSRLQPGLSDHQQSDYSGPMDRASLQRGIDRMRKLVEEVQGTIAVLQKHVDHL